MLLHAWGPRGTWLKPIAKAEEEKTKREAPPAMAASHTADVDATLSRRSTAGGAVSSPIGGFVASPLATTAGGGVADGPGQAAQCTTTSAPSIAAVRHSLSCPATAAARSIVTKSSHPVPSSPGGADAMSTPTTVCPRSLSAVATPRPIRPAAPVTTARMWCLLRWLQRDLCGGAFVAFVAFSRV